METKYSEKELAELAKGVFADDKTSPSIYADEYGTFRNSIQYAGLKDEDKKKFPFEFKNPNVNQVDLEASNAANQDLQSKLDDAMKEIDRLNGLKGVAASKDLQAQLDTANQTIADLKAKYEPAPGK